MRRGAARLDEGEVLVLQNTRWEAGETKNDPDLAEALAELGDAYVNDAFGTCHNDHDASMVAVPAAMKAAGKPRAVGLLVEKELHIIDGLMSSPRHPVLGIMGLPRMNTCGTPVAASDRRRRRLDSNSGT